MLGIPEARVAVVEHPQLQDGMDTTWPAELVAAQVDEHVAAHEPALVLTFKPFGPERPRKPSTQSPQEAA